MKKTFTLVLCVILTMMLTSCGPTKEEAISYNDKIINEQVAIIDKIDKLFDALQDFKNHNGLDYAYAEALKQLETGTGIVSKLEKFDGSSEFRDETLKLFGTYKSVLETELKRMIDIIKLPDDLYTEDAKDEYNKLKDVSAKKMEQGLKDLNTVQKSFATKYKFEIEKSKPR
jgi:hypothetical protein